MVRQCLGRAALVSLSCAFLVLLAGGVTPVEACGGRTVTIADDPKALAIGDPLRGVAGLTLHPAADEGLVVAAADVKISSGLAEAIARRYLTERHGQFRHLDFEAFTYEHGALVYMYHAEVPNLAAGYHVGPIQFVTHHAHIHVDAITGEVYGFGCGGGPGQVDMAFDPKAYPPDLKDKRLPYRQFETHFVVTEAQPPTVDGRIEPAEWADAGHAVIEVGTTKAEVTEYG